MTNLDRMKLLVLAVKDLEEAVIAYEKARKVNEWRDGCDLLELPKHHTRAAIQRRIKQIRQDLLLVGKEYE